MNKTEIVACIYKHVGRTDDLENLTELAEEIARLAAEEEREACAKLCDDIGNALDRHKWPSPHQLADEIRTHE